MKYRIVSIPAFRAVTSGVDSAFDFSDNGKLGKFNAFFSKIEPSPCESFSPRDFLYYDIANKGLVWMYAITDKLDTKDFECFDFEGGIYATYFYEDGDDKENQRLYNEVTSWVKSSDIFALDERENHYSMGHIITPPEVIKKVSKPQMEVFIPIKIK